MSKIPIGGDPSDPHHRYFRPESDCRLSGKGYAAKTEIANLKEIVCSLKRKPDQIIKYMSQKLQCNTKDQITLSGHHDVTEIEEKLENYIEEFVLCSYCGNPETVIEISPKKVVYLRCKACGESTSCPDSKFCSFIVKSQSPSKVTMTRSERRALKLANQAKISKQEDLTNTGEEAGRTDKKSPKKSSKKSEKSKSTNSITPITSDDEDWGEGFSPEEIAARRKELLGNVGSMMLKFVN